MKVALPDKSALLASVKPSRGAWDPGFRPPGGAEPAGPGEESVWDYPRPPILEPLASDVLVEHFGQVVARTSRAIEMKETAGAPVPYIPPEDVQTDLLRPNGRVSVCEWKGAAIAFDLVLPSGEQVADAAWTYPDPFSDLAEGYEAIAGWYAFYPAKLACFVDGERVRPQPGGLYGGWMTDRIKGPVKGSPGTGHW